ncbi:MAG TPA: preprotein translocase subunit SecG [Nitrospiraceae bacterium]|jgi:preprotein translocase subunit SecG|nr:preprotein translocase subunit SecG [Nitrospiraceae bacterium]
MYTLAVVIHVIVCFLMIGAILLQAGKGAEIGAAFGGSSQTVFGSRGPGTFLSKVTVAAAIIFMLTSLGLAVLSKERTFSSTVIDLNKKAAPAADKKQDAVLPQGDPTKSQAPTSTAPEQAPATP